MVVGVADLHRRPARPRRAGQRARRRSGRCDGRYPTVTPGEIDDAGADVVLLPDEPYVFTADDGPEALRTPTRLVSGRLLTWYGPAMVEAHAMLTASLANLHP